MKQVLVNGIHLAYERRGRGVPLVLIHGYPLDHSIWDEVAPLLEDDFDLILPDLRGFGQSDATDTAYSMSDMGGDVAALLDQLNIDKVFLAGHSMGGYVSLAFAQAHPSRVNGLALVASQAAADSPERREGRYVNARQIAEDGISETVAGMTPKLSADTRVQKFVRDLMEKQRPAALIGALKAMAERSETLSMLAAASFPMLLIHGDADILIPIERAREIQSAAPRARLFTLAGASHMPMMEQPQATANALRTFLAK